MRIVVGWEHLLEADPGALPALQSLCTALEMSWRWDEAGATLYIGSPVQDRRISVVPLPLSSEGLQADEEIVSHLTCLLESAGARVLPQWQEAALALTVTTQVPGRPGVSAQYSFPRLLRSRTLAKALTSEVAASTGMPGLPSGASWCGPLAGRRAGAPGCALLIGAPSTPEEAELMSSPDFLRAVAEGAFRGVCRSLANRSLLRVLRAAASVRQQADAQGGRRTDAREGRPADRQPPAAPPPPPARLVSVTFLKGVVPISGGQSPTDAEPAPPTGGEGARPEEGARPATATVRRSISGAPWFPPAHPEATAPAPPPLRSEHAVVLCAGRPTDTEPPPLKKRQTARKLTPTKRRTQAPVPVAAVAYGEFARLTINRLPGEAANSARALSTGMQAAGAGEPAPPEQPTQPDTPSQLPSQGTTRRGRAADPAQRALARFVQPARQGALAGRTGGAPRRPGQTDCPGMTLIRFP